jgi:transketolase N-terminal domain/subunit
MALAPVVYTLWQNFLRFDHDDPIWPNRDRFVLSNGHASMLLYAVLHLSGVKVVNGANTSVSANRSLSHTEPVSAASKRKLENGGLRLATETRRFTTKSLTIAGQRLGRAYLARPNVGGFPTP